MKRKLFRKFLFVGLMLTIGLTMRPAAAPAALPENLVALRQMFAPGGAGTINGFNQLPSNVQNEILAELLNANNNDAQEAFFHAFRNNLLWAIQPLLDRGAYINMHGCYRGPAGQENVLSIAVERGNTAMVDVLTSAKINSYFFGQDCHINCVSRTRCTPLLLAARNGHTEILKLLLDRKANINYRYEDDDGKQREDTALMLAARYGHTDAVKVLLDAYATLDVLNSDDMTALMLASENGHTAAVNLLLGRNTEVNYANRKRNYETALIMAARNGHTAIVKALIDTNATLDTFNDMGTTALMAASERGHTAIVKALIDTKAQIDTSKMYQTGPSNLLGGLFGRTRRPTALAIAAQHSHVATAQTIVDEYRKKIAQSSCQVVQNLENALQRIHDNFEARAQRASGTVNDDNKSNFEQLPNTFLQTMTEYLPLSALKHLRKSSKTCQVISQVQFEAQLITHLKGQFLRKQEDKCRAFIEQETHGANLPNPLAIEPYDYWQAALAAAQEAQNLDADIAGPAAQPGCAIA